jgi:hypothetical protein
MLASNFEGVTPFIFGLALLPCALGFLSLFFWAKGHWLGPLIAIPIFLARLSEPWSLIADPLTVASIETN